MAQSSEGVMCSDVGMFLLLWLLQESKTTMAEGHSPAQLKRDTVAQGRSVKSQWREIKEEGLRVAQEGVENTHEKASLNVLWPHFGHCPPDFAFQLHMPSGS